MQGEAKKPKRSTKVKVERMRTRVATIEIEGDGAQVGAALGELLGMLLPKLPEGK